MTSTWTSINQTYKNIEGYKRVAWPPTFEEKIPKELTPQPQAQFQQYNQQPQLTPSRDVSNQPVREPNPEPNQNFRDVSPGVITLRKEVPISQLPQPVYSSQPATASYRGGSNMRGDLKWPPPEYKEQAALENEDRLKLAKGPHCRPRRVKKDYTQFFAKNALNSYYPSYRVPPGTQHMIN